MAYTPSSLYGAYKPDFCVTRRTIQELCVRREQQILHQIDAASIRLHKGKATFVSPHELNVYNEKGEFDTITADYFVIATGSRPRRPAQFKPDGVHILNSEQILSQPFPNSLLVIGGAAQGSEWASIFSNLGTTKVTLLEKAHSILPRTDDDVRDKVKELLRQKSVTMLEGMDLHTLRVENNVVRYAAVCRRTGQIHEDTVEKALICMGRTPNYEALGGENLKGAMVQNGKVLTDRFGRCTPYRHIYVVGDSSGSKTVRAAETQGRSVIEHAFESRPQSGLRFAETQETQIMFLDQEVATCGWNERQCRERSVAYRVSTTSYRYVARALALNNTKGFVKIIVTADRQQRVLGVSAVGAHASSIVEIASTAVQQQRQVCEFDALFVAYPAIAECFQEAARALRGHSMLKPGSLPGIELRKWAPSRPRGRAYVGDEKQAALMNNAETKRQSFTDGQLN
jgi:dihydrolipoamide dehydrogenase